MVCMITSRSRAVPTVCKANDPLCLTLIRPVSDTGTQKYSRLKLSLRQLLMPDLDSDPVTARCEALMDVSKVPSTKSARNLSI